jgi:DNA recombination protein RmuC
MSIEILLFSILAFQVLIIGLVLFRRKNDQERLFLQSEFARMSKELALALGEARKESNENLSRQFRLIFENQRAGARDQNEALKGFGDVVRGTMQDLNSLQREIWAVDAQAG